MPWSPLSISKALNLIIDSTSAASGNGVVLPSAGTSGNAPVHTTPVTDTRHNAANSSSSSSSSNNANTAAIVAALTQLMSQKLRFISSRAHTLWTNYESAEQFNNSSSGFAAAFAPNKGEVRNSEARNSVHLEIPNMTFDVALQYAGIKTIDVSYAIIVAITAWDAEYKHVQA